MERKMFIRKYFHDTTGIKLSECVEIMLYCGKYRNITCCMWVFQLMSKMAPLLGREMTERVFLERFCEMCCDPLFHVRKVSVLRIKWFILCPQV